MSTQDTKGKAEAAAAALTELLKCKEVTGVDSGVLRRALTVVWEIRDEAAQGE